LRKDREIIDPLVIHQQGARILKAINSISFFVQLAHIADVTQGVVDGFGFVCKVFEPLQCNPTSHYAEWTKQYITGVNGYVQLDFSEGFPENLDNLFDTVVECVPDTLCRAGLHAIFDHNVLVCKLEYWVGFYKITGQDTFEHVRNVALEEEKLEWNAMGELYLPSNPHITISSIEII